MLLFAAATLIPSFFSGAVGCGTAYLMLRITRAYNERKGVESDEKTWRQSRLDAEKALGDTHKAFVAVYVQDKMKIEQDLAAVTGILKEFAEMQRLFTGIATETRGHAGRLDRHDDVLDQVNDRIEAVNRHIVELALNQAKL